MIILIKRFHFIMATPFRNQQNTPTLPLLRKNKHFRIKSASKDKIFANGQLLSARSRHKMPENSKRIFSESRNRKSGSIQTTIKIKIAKQELKKKFEKLSKDTARRKIIVYEGVRTQDNSELEDFQITTRIKTINMDQNKETLNKIARICDPNRILNRQNMDTSQNRETSESTCFKKIKFEKELKEPKGKYRCRVNQYIFEKKKSNAGKKEEDNIDEFWRNVNESLILAGKQQEQASKDLKEFVYDNFITE